MLVAVAGGNPNAHKPSITMVLLCDINCPRNSPPGLNTLICPSPKLPISTTGSDIRFPSSPNDPFPLSSPSIPLLPPPLSSPPTVMSPFDNQPAGAQAIPHGAFSLPRDAKRCTNEPSGLNTSTKPKPGPCISSILP